MDCCLNKKCMCQRKPWACSHPHSVCMRVCVCARVCMCVYFPQSSDDDTVSSVSQENFRRGRRDSAVSCRDWALQTLDG